MWPLEPSDYHLVFHDKLFTDCRLIADIPTVNQSTIDYSPHKDLASLVTCTLLTV